MSSRLLTLIYHFVVFLFFLFPDWTRIKIVFDSVLFTFESVCQPPGSTEWF